MTTLPSTLARGRLLRVLGGVVASSLLGRFAVLSPGAEKSPGFFYLLGDCMNRKHHRAKLGAEQVAKMRRMYRRGIVGYRLLAQEFGCGMSTVRDIVQYRTRAAS